LLCLVAHRPRAVTEVKLRAYSLSLQNLLLFRNLCNVPWLRWLVAGLSLRKPGSVHVEFVVDEVALGQIILGVLQFSLVNIIPPRLSILIYRLGMSNKLVGGRSSET
jgi:hypothetical protein